MTDLPTEAVERGEPDSPPDLDSLAAQAASRLAGISVVMNDLSAPGREPRPGDLASLASAVAILAAEIGSLRFMASANTRMLGQVIQAVADGARADDELRELVATVAEDRPATDPDNPFGIPEYLLPDPDDD